MLKIVIKNYLSFSFFIVWLIIVIWHFICLIKIAIEEKKQIKKAEQQLKEMFKKEVLKDE